MYATPVWRITTQPGRTHTEIIIFSVSSVIIVMSYENWVHGQRRTILEVCSAHN